MNSFSTSSLIFSKALIKNQPEPQAGSQINSHSLGSKTSTIKFTILLGVKN